MKQIKYGLSGIIGIGFTTDEINLFNENFMNIDKTITIRTFVLIFIRITIIKIKKYNHNE